MMENSKGRKLSHVVQSSSNGEEDRISSLPDEILHHILDSFSTIEVVRYSILSTRWKYIWTSIPNLNISNRLPSRVYENPAKIQNFHNFVETVLYHCNLHKFELDYIGIDGGSHLKRWISILSRHKLGELVLRSGRSAFTLPNLVDFSKSIVVLELAIPEVRILLVPASICFHNLKVAHFRSVRFFGDKSTQQVSFSFPVLEEFTVINCCWCEIKTVHIYAPALKKLKLDGWGYETETGMYESEVKIDVMNLISLSIVGRMRHDYSLSYLPSLFEASVNVVGHDSDNKRLVKCFTRLNHVKNLTISDRCIKNLFSSDIFNSLQVFSSLVSLTATHKGQNTFSPQRLINLLCYMPNMECLVIELDGNEYFDDADRIWTHETIPQCSLLKLKLVEIMYFNGGEHELCLIAYLLARTLEKMVISFTYMWYDPERKNTNLTDIQTLPRGSAGTQVIVNFSDHNGMSELHL